MAETVFTDPAWTRADLERIGRERLLRSVPNLPDPPDEPWRRVEFRSEDE